MSSSQPSAAAAWSALRRPQSASGPPTAVDDYRALVASPEVDIVYVGAPVHLHREMVLAAAAAGKHVLCEKPLALDSAEAEEMLAAVRRAGVAHVTSFFVRPFESHQHVKRLVAEGAIREPRHSGRRSMGGAHGESDRQ